MANSANDKVCGRCGSCCKVIPLPTASMRKEYRDFLLERGLKYEQGFILIPQKCQHLTETYHATGPESGEHYFTCTIHDSSYRPSICEKFHGQKRIGMWSVYIPPGCTMRKK